MNGVKNSELQGRWDAAMMPNYGTPPVALARGEGCTVWDVDGREYLDLIGGIAVSALGHAHPALVEAVTRQVGTLAHTSNLFLHEPGVRLAERLLELLGSIESDPAKRGSHPRLRDGKVYLCNSGTEANEAAFKLVRRHAGPGKTYVVAAEQSFHGRTMGSLALTGKSAIREPFGPYGPDVRFVPYGDAASLESVVTDGCAAVFLEPTQGEGGILPAPEGYLREARRICDATGALLVLDEIQSGIGRTGAWFQHQREGMRPDIITLAKGLGGGLPIGACVAFGDHGSIFAKGEHGSTYGGNLVGCAAALAVLDTIERENLLDHVGKVGDQLADGIVATGHPLIVTVRGSGLWRGIVLAEPVGPAVEAAARDAGFLINALRPEVIRLAPPLIIDSDEVQTFVDALPGILEAAR